MSILDNIEVITDDVDLVCLIDVSLEECECLFSYDVEILTNEEVDEDEQSVHSMPIPAAFGPVERRMQFAIEMALEKGLVESGDMIGFVMRLPILDEIVVGSATAERQSEGESLRELFIESEPPIETIRQTLSVAMSLARTGQKGDPVGVLFVVGDEDEVLDRSRPLNYNPFSGADVHISNDVVSASIGEFAKLDGAFIIAETGRVVSANRYLEPRVHDAEVPSGLGARHMAASGITTATDAVSIVVSESDQQLRCFVDGEILLSLNPEHANLLG